MERAGNSVRLIVYFIVEFNLSLLVLFILGYLSLNYGKSG